MDDDVQNLANRLFTMAREGDADTLEQYLDAGTPVNLCNHNGDTLLMLAAYHGHAKTVSALIQHGADVDQTNDRGQTPLAGAVFKSEDAVVDALVRAGADPHAGTPSAIATATMFGRDDYLGHFGTK